MDPAALTVLASTATALLAPYLKRLGEGLSTKVGAEIGSKLAPSAWETASHLYEVVKAKFSATPNTSQVITSLESAPDDPDTQATVRFHLREFMQSDERFSKEIASIIKDADRYGADSVFNTTIHGNVEKLVQMGNVYGDVTI